MTGEGSKSLIEFFFQSFLISSLTLLFLLEKLKDLMEGETAGTFSTWHFPQTIPTRLRSILLCLYKHTYVHIHTPSLLSCPLLSSPPPLPSLHSPFPSPLFFLLAMLSPKGESQRF